MSFNRVIENKLIERVSYDEYRDRVDGVYSDDPEKNPDAQRFETLTYLDALNLKSRVMDSTAISLCMDNDLPIVVLSLWEEDSLEKAASGERIGTVISR